MTLLSGVVHENPQIGSDGESEEGSRHSEDVVSPTSLAPNARNGCGGANTGAGSTSGSSSGSSSALSSSHTGVKMRQKASAGGTAVPRKASHQEEINKRLSLPADLKLPENFVEKLAVSPTLDGPLTRATRRQSLSEIGFGKMDTYTKLDKLGEVSVDDSSLYYACCMAAMSSFSTDVFEMGKRSADETGTVRAKPPVLA